MPRKTPAKATQAVGKATKKAGVRKASTSITAAQRRAVKGIATRFGPVIDLDKYPAVLVEIVRAYGDVMNSEGGGGGGGVGSVGDGVGDGVSSIAVAGPDTPKRVESEEVLRAVLDLRKEVRDLKRRIADQAGPPG